MEQYFNDFNSIDTPSPEELRRKRHRRIMLVLAMVFALVVAIVAFSLLRNENAQPTPASSSSITVTAQTPESAPTPSPAPVGLLVSFLDVGQGDCAFLESPSGKTMLIDGGPESAFGEIDRFLTLRGIPGLDVVFASHLHADHIGGLIQVVDTYPIGNFYYPPFDAESETYFKLLDALEESQAVVSSPLAGVDTLIPWDDAVEVRVLAPYQTVYSDFNDTSYILRIAYGATAVLFTGDATQLGEKLALKAQPNHRFSADVLKVGHHGAFDSTSEAFLSAVSPSIAIISVGTNNGYNLPNSNLLDRLAARGVTIYRTDENGTVSFLLDGTNVTMIE